MKNPRNTPTGVGKTRFLAGSIRKREKHPHGRGEDGGGAGEWSLGVETPPRAWGRRGHAHALCGVARNTPTGVGKTLRSLGGAKDA